MFLERLLTWDSIVFDTIIFLYFVLLLVILFLMFRWFFGEVRKISKEAEGFIKFGQITFILLSWSCFLIILGYYIKTGTEVKAIDIILTVVVGFLGTIIGLFFSERTLERLRGKVEERGKTMFDQVQFLGDTKKLIEENIEQQARIEELEKKLGRR